MGVMGVMGVMGRTGRLCRKKHPENYGRFVVR